MILSLLNFDGDVVVVVVVVVFAHTAARLSNISRKKIL